MHLYSTWVNTVTTITFANVLMIVELETENIENHLCKKAVLPHGFSLQFSAAFKRFSKIWLHVTMNSDQFQSFCPTAWSCTMFPRVQGVFRVRCSVSVLPRCILTRKFNFVLIRPHHLPQYVCWVPYIACFDIMLHAMFFVHIQNRHKQTIAPLAASLTTALLDQLATSVGLFGFRVMTNLQSFGYSFKK